MSSKDDAYAIRAEALTKIYPSAKATGSIHTILMRIAGKRPGGRPALNQIDLDVRKGEAVGIVGRNGSGKSTLLKTLAGALRPTDGRFAVQGRIGTLLDLGAGIHPEYTGAENAVVLSMLAGLSKAEVQERMPLIREFSGLGDAWEHPAKTYSTGMSLRLGFSAAIHSDPDVLLIDEALAVGDAFFQQRCLARMRRLREAGTTIVLVSHDPSAVISLCDRVLWLEHGKVRADGPPDRVIRQYLAARYQDDCLLDAPLAPIATASDLLDDDAPDRAADRPLRPAPAIARHDDRFGDGRAQVVGMEVRNAAGEPIVSVTAGETLSIVITIEARDEVALPLVGFTMRNRLGDVVTATNTELEGMRLPALARDDQIDVAFEFLWPFLSSGAFSLSPAIAEGSIASHRMCDWLENAWILETENARGLFGWMTLDGVRVSTGKRAAEPDGEEETPIEGLDSPGESPRIEFALESPRSALIEPIEITHTNEIFVAGWCFEVSGEPIEIRARIGDGPTRSTAANGFRQDVALVHSGVSSASRSGFGLLVPVPSAPGPAVCSIEAVTRGGAKTVHRIELDLPARLCVSTPPTPKPERPVHHGQSRPRILFVSHSLNLEGAPRSLFEVADGLDASRFDRRLCSPAVGPLGAAWSTAGIPTEHLEWDVSVASQDDFDAQVRRLAGLASVWRPDLIVANTLDAFWAVHMAAELGRPSIWIVRESEPPDVYFHSRLPTPIAERGRTALALADRVVFVAEATRELFRGDLIDGRDRLIPNGLDLSRFDLSSIPDARARVRGELRLDSKSSLLLCVGTTCVRKAQLDLIRALDKLLGSRPDFHCLFLGVVEGPYLDSMRDLIEESSLSRHVTLLPPVRDARPYFAAADVTICNSYQESLPRVVLEAMGFAKPIVASRVFGIPELVRDESEALLVEPGDIDTLAKSIDRILSDPTLASALGRAARDRVSRRFSLESCIRDYSDLFDEVLASGTGANP